MAVNDNECWRLIYSGWPLGESTGGDRYSDRYSDSFSGLVQWALLGTVEGGRYKPQAKPKASVKHGRGAEEATLARWGIASPWHPWSHAPIWVKLAAKATSPRGDSIAVQEGTCTRPPTSPTATTPVPEVLGTSPAHRSTLCPLSSAYTQHTLCPVNVLLQVTCSAKPPVTDGDDDHGNGLDLFLSPSIIFIFIFIHPPRCPNGGGLNKNKNKKDRFKLIPSHSHGVTYRCVASCPVRGTFSSRASAEPKEQTCPCHARANATQRYTTAHNIRGAGFWYFAVLVLVVLGATQKARALEQRLDRQSGNLQRRRHAHRCK